jgi:hypothetical protein
MSPGFKRRKSRAEVQGAMSQYRQRDAHAIDNSPSVFDPIQVGRIQNRNELRHGRNENLVASSWATGRPRGSTI